MISTRRCRRCCRLKKRGGITVPRAESRAYRPAACRRWLCCFQRPRQTRLPTRSVFQPRAALHAAHRHCCGRLGALPGGVSGSGSEFSGIQSNLRRLAVEGRSAGGSSCSQSCRRQQRQQRQRQWWCSIWPIGLRAAATSASVKMAKTEQQTGRADPSAADTVRSRDTG